MWSCTYNGFASPSSLVIRTKVVLLDLDAKEHAEMECTQEAQVGFKDFM